MLNMYDFSFLTKTFQIYLPHFNIWVVSLLLKSNKAFSLLYIKQIYISFFQNSIHLGNGAFLYISSKEK